MIGVRILVKFKKATLSFNFKHFGDFQQYLDTNAVYLTTVDDRKPQRYKEQLTQSPKEVLILKKYLLQKVLQLLNSNLVIDILSIVVLSKHLR